MSDSEKPAEKKSDDTAPDESKPIDPELDIRSEAFNPLKAIYSTKTYVPVTKAKIYDNIAKFESVMAAQAREKKSSTKDGSDGAKAPKQPQKTKREFGELTRRFLPHQGLVQGKGVKPRHQRNILKRMEKENMEGPLGKLKTWKDKRTRIKIYTRNEKQVNGYVTGFIEAFDKHWNIALSDVLEVWKRRKLHYCHSIADNEPSDEYSSIDECIQRLQELNVELPEISVKSINRKYAECSRHISQLVVRGEHIAVVILDKKEIK